MISWLEALLELLAFCLGVWRLADMRLKNCLSIFKYRMGSMVVLIDDILIMRAEHPMESWWDRRVSCIVGSVR